MSETAAAIVAELKGMGSESIKRIFMNHGAKEPFFGVKVADMKTIHKRVKTNHPLALELFDTGVGEAQYLAGYIVDDVKMTKKDLQHWVDSATWGMVSEYTVPWVASGNPLGYEMALKWVDSKKETVAAAGWCTLSSIVARTDDKDLDIPALKKLLERVQKTIHQQPNRVRYTMNGFVIAVGSYVKPLTATAMQVAEKVGIVEVNMGNTECKVPYAPDYIKKVKANTSYGKKRKTVKC